MRNIFSTDLLKQLHLSRYVYLNEDFNEVYAWFGGPEVKILNYTGEEVGKATVVNSNNDQEYTINDDILERDVQLSIDSIVHDLFKSNE